MLLMCDTPKQGQINEGRGCLKIYIYTPNPTDIDIQNIQTQSEKKNAPDTGEKM